MSKIDFLRQGMRRILPSPGFWYKRKSGQLWVTAIMVAATVGFLVWLEPVLAVDNVSVVAEIFIKLLKVLAGVLSDVLTWLIGFLITLAGYNNFINADIVSTGWVLVRDVANMFYILVLLVIAFGTMLKLEQYTWKKMLPRLLITAIAVNFSKTIIGVMIDFSQVVMLTFVNGFAATGPGNFLSMLGVEKIYKIATNSPTGCPDLEDAVTISYILAVVILGISVIVIGIFVALLLFRIVAIWLLIVLAPLAWLFGTIPGRGQKYYAEWWDKFINQLVMGPALAFFLWLALATLGGGNNNSQITQGNAVAAASDSTNKPGMACVITELGGWENMGGFAVAVATLLMGLQMVSQMGVAGASLASGAMGMMKGAATKVAKKGAVIAGVGAFAAGGAIGLGGVGGVVAAGGLALAGRKTWKDSRSWRADKLHGVAQGVNTGLREKLPGFVGKKFPRIGKVVGAVGSFVGGAVATPASRYAGKMKEEFYKESGEKIKGMDNLNLDQRIGAFEGMQPTALSPRAKIAKMMLGEQIIEHPGFAKEVRSRLDKISDPAEKDAARERYHGVLQQYTDLAAGDEKKMEKVKNFKQRNPDLLHPDTEVKTTIEGTKIEDTTKIAAPALKEARVVKPMSERQRNRIRERGSEEQIKNMEETIRRSGGAGPAPGGAGGARGVDYDDEGGVVEPEVLAPERRGPRVDTTVPTEARREETTFVPPVSQPVQPTARPTVQPVVQPREPGRLPEDRGEGGVISSGGPDKSARTMQPRTKRRPAPPAPAGGGTLTPPVAATSPEPSPRLAPVVSTPASAGGTQRPTGFGGGTVGATGGGTQPAPAAAPVVTAPSSRITESLGRGAQPPVSFVEFSRTLPDVLESWGKLPDLSNATGQNIVKYLAANLRAGRQTGAGMLRRSGANERMISLVEAAMKTTEKKT